MSKNILIIGANGFIGNALSEVILNQTDWTVFAMDIYSDKLEKCLGHERFHFLEGDMTKEHEWIEKHMELCDTFLPLAAIATPITYVKEPLRIFNLDFEANLSLVRLALKHKTRVIFPSTSEVYGMCQDEFFDEETSSLTVGPIEKQRWIYSCAKQMLDRVIYASGIHEGLEYTIFRPFNFYGPKLDDINKQGVRALTQFIGNCIRGQDIELVDGGAQRRCFCYIDDAIDALVKIIENKDGKASQRIINIGNPYEDSEASIKKLAELTLEGFKQYPKYSKQAAKVKLIETSSEQYYGKGYQDMAVRRPAINNAKELLGWEPKTKLEDGIRKTLDHYLTSTTQQKSAETVS